MTDDDTIQTEEAIQHLRRYFHIYEGWSYYTLRCEICQQIFGIKPNVPILERSSFDMLMNHAKAHNTTPIRTRVRGFAPWSPEKATLALLDRVLRLERRIRRELIKRFERNGSAA